MVRALKKDFIGKVFGFLTITDLIIEPKKRTTAKYICRCGKTGQNILAMIKVGHVKSCGCITTKYVKNTKRQILNNFNVDCSEASYWAGFLFGDGSINKKGAVQVCLSSITPHTVDHLRKLSNFIYGKDYVLVYKTRCVLQIRHEDIAKNLKKYGIIPNKTYRGKLRLPDNYKPDFIRGFFDADGWFSISPVKATNGKYYDRYCWGICSYRKNALLEIKKYLQINERISKKKNQHLFELRVSNKVNLLKIIEAIGTNNDNIQYKRKWDKLWNFYRKYRNVEINQDTNRLKITRVI